MRSIVVYTKTKTGAEAGTGEEVLGGRNIEDLDLAAAIWITQLHLERVKSIQSQIEVRGGELPNIELGAGEELDLYFLGGEYSLEYFKKLIREGARVTIISNTRSQEDLQELLRVPALYKRRVNFRSSVSREEVLQNASLKCPLSQVAWAYFMQGQREPEFLSVIRRIYRGEETVGDLHFFLGVQLERYGADLFDKLDIGGQEMLARLRSRGNPHPSLVYV